MLLPYAHGSKWLPKRCYHFSMMLQVFVVDLEFYSAGNDIFVLPFETFTHSNCRLSAFIIFRVAVFSFFFLISEFCYHFFPRSFSGKN